MKYNSPKEVFDIYAPNIICNEDLYNILKLFRLGWSQKSDDYIEFLGHNLTGVYPIRFSIQDDETLFEFLRTDKNNLQKAIFDIKGVQSNMRTISNVVYVTLIYIAHLFTISNLKKEVREDAIKECYYIFSYKVVSSLTAHYFKYNVDIATAKAVNEKMSNKFLIKKFDSWQKLFEYKSEDLLPKGIHHARMITFTTNDMIRIISDLQTKLRDIFKNNFGVLLDVQNNKEKVHTTSLLQKDEEGEESIRDITNRSDSYINYIKSIINSKPDFISNDLIEFIISCLIEVRNENLRDMLEYISSQDISKLDFMIDNIIEDAINFLTKRKLTKNINNNLYEITTTMISYWKSSNIVNSKIIKIKKDLMKTTGKVLKSRVPSKVTNTTIGVMVYIVIKSFFKK